MKTSCSLCCAVARQRGGVRKSIYNSEGVNIEMELDDEAPAAEQFRTYSESSTILISDSDSDSSDSADTATSEKFRTYSDSSTILKSDSDSNPEDIAMDDDVNSPRPLKRRASEHSASEDDTQADTNKRNKQTSSFSCVFMAP